MAKEVVELGMCSGRQACRYFGLSRSTFSYTPKDKDAKYERLRKRIITLSLKHRRWGYKKIRTLLREEGWDVGKKLVQRIRREEGLKVPPRKPKQYRRGNSTGLPTKATHRGHVWSWDFIHDRTVRGGAIKTLTVIDEYTRECHCLKVDRTIKAEGVIEAVSKLIDQHGAPEHIRSDNGPEFISKKLQQWLKTHKVKTLYIEPGSPWQNGFVESFHGKFRDECLNRELLYTLTEARVVIEDFRLEYNSLRPHASLGNLTPQRFAQASGSGRPTASLHQNLVPPNIETINNN